MVSLKTHGDRTLFFDFLPFNMGKIKGYDIKIQLYTVPGQVKYNATRKLVLRGVDGIVFVADATTEEPGRKCPICRHKMDKVNIGPGRRVMIDSCPTGCGLWFDSNELADLAGHLRDDGWHVQPGVHEFLSGMFPTKGDT